MPVPASRATNALNINTHEPRTEQVTRARKRNTYVTYTHTHKHTKRRLRHRLRLLLLVVVVVAVIGVSADDGSFESCSTLSLRFQLFCPCAFVIYFCGFYVDSAPAAVVLLLYPVFLKMFTIVNSWFSLPLSLSLLYY